MWQIIQVSNPKGAQLWFSDGLPVLGQERGGSDSSHRLIVENQGFLDITELHLPRPPIVLIDFNGSIPEITKGTDNVASELTIPSVINISLRFPGDGTFSAVVSYEAAPVEFSSSGLLKPLPVISQADAEFLDDMIKRKYVPYQNIPDAPGKTVEELQKLGKQFFPFTPYSFELAMATYDWTTASFARLVFNKVFEYTSIPPQPFPLDEYSLADMIWQSNWNTYNPRDKDYMNSFMMQPASSLEDVQSQLTIVRDRLHEFSNVENRLVALACQALPRTPLLAKRQLYSGQVDIYQFGLDRFGIEFLECPLNAGPVGEQLIIAFDAAISSYVSAGNVVTTKMVWSFTDSIHDAMHYENGILLVANPPDDNSWVWESATYVTPLSNDPAKTEYVFPPGTSFLVQKVEQETIEGKQVVVINLQPIPPTPVRNEGIARRDFKVAPLPAAEYAKHAESYSPELERKVQIVSTEGVPQYKIPHKTRGRRCRCLGVAEGRVAPK